MTEAAAAAVYVDTGAFLARYLARDQFHGRAAAGWKAMAAGRFRPFTSNFVLDETFTLLGRRAGHAFAAERARAVYSSDALVILRPDEADERAALILFEKLADQEVSFTDCISFALMDRHGLRHVFGFDRHFAAAGFRLWSGAGR